MYKKKKFLTAVTVSIVVVMFFACGQKYQGKLVPMLDNSNGKWGLADTLGKIVIAPKWDMVKDFSEGLAVVGLNNKYGYIDETGIEKIPITYDNASPFSEGLAEVELDGKIGSIDTTGAIIVPFQYKELQYLIGLWGLSQAKLNNQPSDAPGFNRNIILTPNNIKSDTLTFEKNGIFKSNINFSGLFDGDFKESKSLKIEENDCWKYENFVTGQQEKDKYIFSCDLILLPLSQETIYKLILVSKDELRMEFYEDFNVSNRQTQLFTTKGGVVPLQSVFEFKRINKENKD